MERVRSGFVNSSRADAGPDEDGQEIGPGLSPRLLRLLNLVESRAAFPDEIIAKALPDALGQTVVLVCALIVDILRRKEWRRIRGAADRRFFWSGKLARLS